MKYKSANERTRVQTHTEPDAKSRVLQSEKKNADINTIVARAKQTGQLPVLMGREHVQQLPNHITYQESLNQVVQARTAFERLPASIRNKFENKPENMLASIHAAQNDAKLAEALREIGLLEALPPPEPKAPLKTETTEVAPAA